MVTMYSIVVFDGRDCHILRGLSNLFLDLAHRLWEISTSKSAYNSSIRWSE